MKKSNTSSIKSKNSTKSRMDYRIEVINGFFDRFTYKTETGYFKWNDNLRIGDVVDYMIKSVNERTW